MVLKYIDLACLHGIGTSPIQQQTFSAEWEAFINAQLAKVQPTVKVRCHRMYWDSSGDPMRDLANVVSSRNFREDQIQHIQEQVDRLLPVASMFVTHSLGCAWIMAVLSKLKSSMPALTGIGGPMGHPIWGRVLSSVGLRWDNPQTNVKPVHFWNSDDGVSSLGNWYSTPQGWESRRVEVFPVTNGFKEHAVRDYLTHPLFIRHLTE